MVRDKKLYSGFMNHDYVLCFHVKEPAARQKLLELCEGPWQGDEITPNTWEISNSLSPDELESAIVAILGDEDRAAYYYLSDTKRMFRVVLG